MCACGVFQLPRKDEEKEGKVYVVSCVLSSIKFVLFFVWHYFY